MKIKNQFSLIKQVVFFEMLHEAISKKKAPVKVLFLKIIIFSISPIFIAIAHPTELFFFFMSFITLLVWFGLVGPTPPYGLLSDMALETSTKNCQFFNHLLMVPLPTSNLSAIACKVIPVALNSLACSLFS